MYDFIVDSEVKREALSFVRSVDPELLRGMDRGEIVFPKEFLREAARRGLLGLRFPKKYGGRGLRWVDEVAVIEEIGVLGFTLGCLYSLVSIVGEPINVFGTEEQKKRYLEPMIRGEKYGAEAITEPQSGSDVFGMTATRAEKRNGYYVLNGQKRFVVGGVGADFFVTYAVTNPKARDPRRRLSAFIVERGEGLEVKTVYGTMGTRGGGTARIIYRDLKVPEENLLGPLHGGYMVFNRMMVPERLTSAAGAIGVAMAALEIAVMYSDVRMAFGRKIRAFEGVSFKVADMMTSIDAARGLVYTAARAADELIESNLSVVRRLVSEAKLFSTEVAWRVTSDAMQILGGIGYTDVFPVERLLRDARLGMIWTGTNEIMRLIVQHEVYKELLSPEYRRERRNVELDAVNSALREEKYPGEGD